MCGKEDEERSEERGGKRKNFCDNKNFNFNKTHFCGFNFHGIF